MSGDLVFDSFDPILCVPIPIHRFQRGEGRAITIAILVTGGPVSDGSCLRSLGLNKLSIWVNPEVLPSRFHNGISALVVGDAVRPKVGIFVIAGVVKSCLTKHNFR